jgi:RimJ/RimL family protein N-acetyltransferase
MSEDRVRLRLATPDDCRRVWIWANEPVVRAASFSSDTISWEQHVVWYHEKLKDSTSVFYIIEDRNRIAIGQIRFDIEDDGATISVSLDQAKRGQGYGHTSIHLAVTTLLQKRALTKIHAYVKPDNQASRRAFLKAGFRYVGDTQIKGQPAVHLIYKKDSL